MRWGLVAKPNDKTVERIAKEVYSFIKENGEVFAETKIAKPLGIKGFSTAEINKEAEVVVTVGGDGTILFALKEIDKPIFAINSSAMGFLTEVDAKYAESGLKKLLKGDYNVEERAKLKVLLDEERLPDAANEVTVQTATIAKIIDFNIFVDDEVIDVLKADGVIIATPTGATGYALSVGGPIVDPRVDAAVIAPIAPFRLSTRPWIVPIDKRVCVELAGESKVAKLVVDGRDSFDLHPGQRVCITLSETRARFIRFGETFYQTVRLKLVR
ncbi:MAG: NAD(+)/NADH kinase [Thermoplasmata archaeon]|nr:MAG: NAD(+)/NADH kinase [Thermoplasmata archaeon]MCD6467829.1 NAD(+)/NADH kinase [Thermoplasmata archaeon]RLF28222.1 MAG: sugar kinase [Thermoplasmata archaeon]